MSLAFEHKVYNIFLSLMDFAGGIIFQARCKMTRMSDCEVAVIGAGPYGLAVAARLKQAHVQPRVFGQAMSFWRNHMPKGMLVRSPPTNSDIGSPDDAFTISAYADQVGLKLEYPVALEVYIGYGEWYQAKAVPDLDARKIDRVEKIAGRFVLHLDDGDRVTANRVVVATGLEHQEFKPALFNGLPREFVSHSCEHRDLTKFRGKRVAVIGSGQSACESAAILNEIGADVELISRRDVHWLGSQAAGVKRPLGDAISHLRTLTSSKSGIGPFPLNRVVENPGIVHMLPCGVRDVVTERCLRSGATKWLRPRLESVALRPNRDVVAVRTSPSKIVLQLDKGECAVDHVLLATGYQVDCSRLGLFGPAILQALACRGGAPLLSAGFESSISGLHFVGASAVQSFGPLMRFVAGSKYTALQLARTLSPKKSAMNLVLSQAAKGWRVPVGGKVF